VTNRESDSGAAWMRGLRVPARVLLWTRAALGRHLSVRWKLTLWYGLMCAAALGAAGIAMSLSFQQQLKSSIDDSMRSTAAKLSANLARTTSPSTFSSYATQVQEVLYNNSYQSAAPGQFEQAQLLNTAPNARPPSCLIQSRVKTSCGTQGVSLEPLDLSRAAHQPLFLTRRIRGELVRVYLRPLQIPPSLHNVFGVLEVFQQEHNYIDIQNRLNLILLFAIPLTLLVAVVAGWWIARAALRPINRISRTVLTIGESHDLSRRLNFVGPSDEVGRLATTFDGMMDRLEKVFETQKRFVADASHELRTPLTAIRGNADLYSIAPPEERDLCVASIRREAERMSRLVADLLLLAAADIEERPIHKQTVALDDLLRDVYRAALILASDNVTVSLDVRDGVAIEADGDRIKQLVLNLVDNAVKFTPAGGHVTISLHASPDEAVIQVADTGIGIAPEEQQAIFDRFYRVEHARSRRGSGLGLSISSWIAAAHGGSIDVESQPGSGSTFTVHLPGPVALETGPLEGVISRPAE